MGQRVTLKVGLVSFTIALGFVTSISRLALLLHHIQEQLDLLDSAVFLLKLGNVKLCNVRGNSGSPSLQVLLLRLLVVRFDDLGRFLDRALARTIIDDGCDLLLLSCRGALLIVRTLLALCLY